ncbi:MAG: PLP-dependent aminotransferase family protein [Oscillospiraceae bacterium]|nr:PLP-dependent aminotransferase family protein [Oscillospiraceae bacterium]
MNSDLINESVPLYMRVYNYYKKMIINGQLSSGMKIPSIRQCAEELRISRTTVETAYMSLAADGYIISKAQSGFYVTETAYARAGNANAGHHVVEKKEKIRYDFISAAADAESFNFDMWRRYIKSALRQDERLLSYGEPQGEKELREVLSKYITHKRNVVCTPENIVVGAGIQSLLHIICVLADKDKKICFQNKEFIQGISVFRDHGWCLCDAQSASVIYSTPSHISMWGDVMDVRDRLSLIKNAAHNSKLIIEDDYDNEFSYFNKRTPSLQSLAAGQNVIYIGTFSRMLLPSIRMSFMVIPPQLTDRYMTVRNNYNQTASKTEQIALCQFIRDGHLDLQIRKQRKLYNAKAKHLCEVISEKFGSQAEAAVTDSGIYVKMKLKEKICIEDFKDQLHKKEISLNVLKNDDDTVTAVFSCTSVKSESFEEAVSEVKAAYISAVD